MQRILKKVKTIQQMGLDVTEKMKAQIDTTCMEAFKGICLSLPRVVGLKGVLAELQPDLSSEEYILLQKSAEILKESVAGLKIT